MNNQFMTPDFVEKADDDTNIPEVNSDPFADKVPTDVAFPYAAPVSEAVASDDLVNGPLATEYPVYQPTVQKFPMTGDAAVDYPLGETIVQEAEVSEVIATEASPIDPNGGSAALLDHEKSEHFRTRWSEVQGMFVDEPRVAVQQADALVSEVMDQITQMFTSEHTTLEGQWKQGNDVSTEDLRTALKRYRSFFNRLVV